MRRPGPQQPLRQTLARAFNALRRQDVRRAAACAGASLVDGTIRIDLLGRAVTVDPDAGEVRDADGGCLEEYAASVVARHLALAQKLPRDLGPDVSFADDGSARGYLTPFHGRVLAPLLGRFGADPEGFARAAEAPFASDDCVATPAVPTWRPLRTTSTSASERVRFPPGSSIRT